MVQSDGFTPYQRQISDILMQYQAVTLSQRLFDNLVVVIWSDHVFMERPPSNLVAKRIRRVVGCRKWAPFGRQMGTAVIRRIAKTT